MLQKCFDFRLSNFLLSTPSILFPLLLLKIIFHLYLLLILNIDEMEQQIPIDHRYFHRESRGHRRQMEAYYSKAS